MDRTLSDVTAPAGVIGRLRKIGTLIDSDLDGEMRHIGVPGGLLVRLRQTVRRQVLRPHLVQMAVAASLAFILAGVYWINSQSQPEPGNPNVVVNGGKGPRDGGGANGASGGNGIVAHNGNKSEGGRKVGLGNRLVDNHPIDDHHVDNGGGASDRVPAAQRDPSSVDQPANSDNPNSIANTPVAQHGLPTDKLPHDAPLTPDDVLGGLVAPAAELSVAMGVSPRGVAPPVVKGYDWSLLLKHGVHPFVQPSRSPALRESRVPLWTDTSSYELAQRSLEARQFPPANLIHTEDFLAAMEYGFPPPAMGDLALRTAAGQDPWGQGNIGLMQIGAQAGSFHRGLDFGTHLTICVDASAAMGAAGRWELIRSALGELAGQLDPRDRVSLVLFSYRPTQIVVQADRDSLLRALGRLEGLEPRGQADLETALRMAIGDARQDSIIAANVEGVPPDAVGKKRASRLLLVTNGALHVEAAASGRLRRLLGDAIAAGVAWQVVNVRSDGVSDPELDALAAVGGRAIRHVGTLRDLSWQLRDAAVGRSQVVAARVSWKVTFSPDAVESYRLIGHEPSLAGGLASGPLEGELRSGEAATALYAVELKGDGGETVATVDISWFEPGSSKEEHHLRQVIGRQQFAPSWAETPLSLQMAAVAAETAEILRGSYSRRPIYAGSMSWRSSLSGLIRHCKAALASCNYGRSWSGRGCFAPLAIPARTARAEAIYLISARLEITMAGAISAVRHGAALRPSLRCQFLLGDSASCFVTSLCSLRELLRSAPVPFAPMKPCSISCTAMGSTLITAATPREPSTV